MKFAELSLERYGVYEKLSVPFDLPGLTVVYGPNEAGKSTCLVAISDFLFGIPNNSSHGQRFGYDAMRIGAALLLADGRRLVLRRRKGHRRTLLDENDKTVDDLILGKLLGTVTRGRFGTLFGLDHRSLREGAETLLSAEGDIGRLILEAGGGLRAMVESIDKLGEEADTLFAPRSSEKRKFYQVYGQFAEAEREVKEGTLTFEAYQQARELLREAERKHQELKRRRAQLEARQSALERAHRVLPLLGQLDQIDREIEGYRDVSHLRPEFATEVKNTLGEGEQARKELDESAKRRKNLEDQIGGLMIDQALLEAEAEIATIHQKSIHVAKEREDRPNREKEMEEQKARLVRLRDYLKLGPDADLKSCLPPADVRERVRQLASDGKSLAGRIAQLEKQVGDNQFEVEAIRRKQQELQKQGFNRSVDIDVATLKTLPRLLREIEERNGEADIVERKVNPDLAKWGFSNIEELREFLCPDVETVEGEIKCREEIADDIETHKVELREATKKLSTAQKAIERLQAAGEVPTDAAIDQARSARSEAWEPIRSTYLSDDPSALASIPRSQREHNVRQLEERIEDADRLADRKSAEAKRLTDLAAAEKQRDEANAEIEAATKACQELEGKLGEQVRRFTEAWPQATQKESDLTRLKLLVRQRDAILEQANRAASLRGEANARQGEANPIVSRLALAESDLGLHPAPDAELEKRLRDLERRVKVHSEQHDKWRENAARLEEMERQLGKARQDLENLKTKHAQWRREWHQAMSQIGLPVDSTIEFVVQVINECSEGEPALALIGSTQHRLEQFDRDEQTLISLIKELSPRLSFELPDDPVAAAGMLSARLQNTKELDTQRCTLATQLKDARKDCEEKRHKADELNGRVQNLCAEANADNETFLKRIVDRLNELLEKQTHRAEILGQIRAAGDGKPLEELRAECEGRDRDALKAELEGIKSDKEHLDGEIEQAYADMKSHERELEQFRTAAGINAAESRRQSAAAEMRAVIERYLEVQLARELLDQAINRLREERQDPLIARASELFRLATRGSFVGIATDVDGQGNPVVVGKRAGGEQVHVNLMSDGARDQLFLAFRIASVEDYCKQAEPLPFIADDLLVHFDDERSGAALELLAEFGRRTQVLLFTHHRSVRDMAQQLAAEKKASIYDLAT